MTGYFISIEGIEGAGKSSAMPFISNYLMQHRVDAIVTREPGGTPFAEDIRRVLLQPRDEVVMPQAELLLMFAGRVQHIRTCIQPALQAGKWVVSDRFVDASYAYQGGGRGIDQRQIAWLDEQMVGDCHPQLTFLLDIPVELGLSRAMTRQAEKDRIEQEAVDFFTRVRNVYLERAKQFPARMKVIDASQSIADVEAQLRDQLEIFLRESV